MPPFTFADAVSIVSAPARPLVQVSRGTWKFGAWTITFDPPPVPFRGHDYSFSHADFDASWEGEEDGWVGNGLSGHAGSVTEALAEIAMIEIERGEG